jgi:hypothetical protein
MCPRRAIVEIACSLDDPPLPGPINVAESLSLTRMGLLHNITKRAYMFSFVFDFTLIESDRSEPIRYLPQPDWGASFIEPGSAGSKPGENKAEAGPSKQSCVSDQLDGDLQVINREAS